MYSGGNTVSALSHSNDDDRISPVQSDLKRLIKDTEQMFRDLTILRESDPMSLSSGVQLELAQAKERMLRVVHNTPATTNDPITEELKKSVSMRSTEKNTRPGTSMN